MPQIVGYTTRLKVCIGPKAASRYVASKDRDAATPPAHERSLSGTLVK